MALGVVLLGGDLPKRFSLGVVDSAIIASYRIKVCACIF